MRKIEDISALDIEAILPHRKPFLLIDKLISYNSDTLAVKTSFLVKRGGVFVCGDALSAAGILENIAQSCAAKIGFFDWLNELPVKPGVIGSVKNLKIHTYPKIGQLLITEITPVTEVLGVMLANAVVRLESGSSIAEATIKVAV